MLLKIDLALRDLVYERQAEQCLFKMIVKQFLFKVLDLMYDLSLELFTRKFNMLVFF